MTNPLSEAELNATALMKATKVFTEEVRLRSWYHSISTAILLAGCWMAIGISTNLPLQIVCSLLTGLLIVRMFVIYHDHQHGAILKHSRLATIAMRTFGIIALAPSSVWLYSHNYHHGNNSRLRSPDIGSFPVMTTEEYATSSFTRRMIYRLMRHPICILLSYPIAFIGSMCITHFLSNPKRHWDGLVAILLHVGIAIFLVAWGGWWTLLLVQTIPHFLACALGGYLFYAQHNFPGVTLYDSNGWTYHAAALESSSYLRMDPIMRWFTANIGYHHIHHLNARIPFYRLPETMAALPALQKAKSTTFSPIEVWRCLRLALWDVERQRMVNITGR